jgi:Ca2+-transporting ATPase
VPLQGNHLLMVIMLAALPTFILSGIKEIFGLRWL